MRLNIYSQELITDDGSPTLALRTELVEQVSNTGVTYSAVRLFLHSSDRLHHPPVDDDRSAITFWLPKSAHRREYFALKLEELASLVRSAAEESGLD